MDDKKRKVVKCRTRGCDNVTHSRGVCQKCLATIRVAIAAGQTTDEELVSRGVMLPIKKRGPKSHNPIASTLAGIARRKS